jgi:hypothetical protein
VKLRHCYILLCLAIQASATSASGRLEGIVRDASTNVMPGVMVSCLQEETGFRFTTATNDFGEFQITVPSGHYTLVISRSGFRAAERMGVQVPAKGTARTDFLLEPSSRREVVTVNDTISPRTLAQDDGAVVLTQPDLTGLPQNDRTVSGLLTLAPGVLVTPANAGEPGQISSLGARSNSNSYTVDGVSGNNAVNNGGWPSFLPGGKLPAMTALGTTHNLAVFEDVEQVRLQPDGLSPENTTAPGASIAIRTRSGTNQLHGSMFAANRPEAASAADWFANAYSAYHIPRSTSWLNDQGVAFGGPLQRDRTFFFVSAERLDLRQTYTWATTVPSVTARLLAPISLLPFLNAFPLPNGPSTASFGISELVGSSVRPANLTAGSVRLDRALQPQTRAFLRLAYTPSKNESGFSQVAVSRYRYAIGVLGLTHDGHSWIHDTRLSFGLTEASSRWSANGSAISAADFFSQFPSFAAGLAGVSVGGAGSVVVGQNGRNRQNQLEISHTASWQHGGHELRTGGSYLELDPKRNGVMADLTVAFSSPGELFSNQAAPIWITYIKVAARTLRLQQPAGFAQDSWRIHPRFTVTWGVRLAGSPAPRMPAGPNLYSVDETGGVVRGYAPVTGSLPLWRGSKLHLDPTFSVAWQMASNTVLRASFSTVHDTNFGVATDPLNGTPYLLMTIQGTGPLLPTTPLSQIALGSGYTSDLRIPVYRRWVAALQRDWKERDWLSLSYSGMAGTNLLRRETILRPTPGLGQLNFASNDGISSYHGLQALYKRSLQHGLQANVTASWSHSIDVGSSESALFQLTPQRGPRNDRGASDFDVRHTLSVGMVYSLASPFPRLRPLLSGWTFGASLYARTAFPVDVMVSETTSGFVIANQRPNLVRGVPLWVEAPALPAHVKLNQQAFSSPVNSFGTLGRNAVRGFGMWQADASIGRDLRPHGDMHMALRMEAFNVLNHPLFADPLRYRSSPLFGQSTSPLNLMLGSGSPTSGQSPAFQMGGPRSVQVSLRVNF